MPSARGAGSGRKVECGFPGDVVLTRNMLKVKANKGGA